MMAAYSRLIEALNAAVTEPIPKGGRIQAATRSTTGSNPPPEALPNIPIQILKLRRGVSSAEIGTPTPNDRVKGGNNLHEGEAEKPPVGEVTNTTPSGLHGFRTRP